ncbi:MAG: tetratricopeptide repeat protein, partial [Nitrospiraceae bacterium]
MSVLLSGCLAQQADLKQVEQSHGGQLQNLSEQGKDLSDQVEELDRRIDQQEQALSAQRVEIREDNDRLISELRARLSEKVTNIREEDLPAIRGDIDKNAHRLDQVRTRLDDLDHKLTQWLSVVEKVQQDQGALLKADRDRFQQGMKADRQHFQDELQKVAQTIGTMAQTVDTRLDEQAVSIRQGEERNRELMTEQVGQLSDTLANFKRVLEELGQKIIQEEERVNNLSVGVTKDLQQLTAKIDTDNKATLDYLENVNERYNSVTKALETVGGTVAEQMEKQDRYLSEVSKSVQASNVQVTTLQNEMVALQGGVATTAALAQMEQSLKTQVSEQDRYLDELTKSVEAISKQVVTLNDTMATSVNLKAVEKAFADRTRAHDKQLAELATAIQNLNVQLASLNNHVKGLRQGQKKQGERPPKAKPSSEKRSELQTGQPSQLSLELPGAPEGSRSAVPLQTSTLASSASGNRLRDYSDKRVYEQQLRKLRQGDLDGAKQGFTDFLQRYPSSVLAPNAQYWLGECYYGKNQFKEAILAFDQVHLVYPGSPKVPAALLKKGYAYLALND